jgi:hypothetical protein
MNREMSTIANRDILRYVATGAYTIILVPWLLIAAGAFLIFDVGTKGNALVIGWIFVANTYAYPITYLVCVLFAKRFPLLLIFPLIHICLMAAFFFYP